ncbi:MAG: AMP-binding protein [Cyanobacteria bacterium P01_E01_bin.45]
MTLNTATSVTLSDIWAKNAKLYPNQLALWNPHAKPEEKYTYQQLNEAIQHFAAGLQALGIQQGARLAIVADNSPRWLIADQGSLLAGAVNVPRGGTAPVPELSYIIEHSGSTVLVAENAAVVERLKDSDGLESIRHIIQLYGDPLPDCIGYDDLLERGQAHTLEEHFCDRSTLATIIYTSGTTGRPKGVMLLQKNLMHQVEAIAEALPEVKAGQRFLSILPTWHSYERAGEYFLLSRGCEMVYTSRRYIKEDLKRYQPHYMVAVPRIWETVYEGAQRQFREKSATLQAVIFFCLSQSSRWVELGRKLTNQSLLSNALSLPQFIWVGLQRALLTPIHLLGEKLVYCKVREAVGPNFVYAVSGGGSLAGHLETFYETIGVQILVGYGLTETSPVLTCRRAQRNVRGTSGLPLPDTEIQICNPETLEPLPYQASMLEARTTRGLVRARGPQVMVGYYQNPAATHKVLDGDGWFDTGDLGWLTPDGQLVLTGRAKDTIVLTNGENIEPQPLEDACAQSPWVDQIVMVGQDRKRLAALVYPNITSLVQDFGDSIAPEAQQLTGSNDPTQWADSDEFVQHLLSQSTIQKAVLTDLQQRLKQRVGYRPDELVREFRFVPNPFTIENGLMTQTYKIRRNKVADIYAETIAELYAQG